MKTNLRALTVIVVAVVFAVLLNTLTHIYDNKYTYPGRQAQFGILDMEGSPVTGLSFLTEGWEFYRGRLLKPEDFASGELMPDEYVYIGQYTGFGKERSDSAYGEATYRIRILTGSEGSPLRLELPEIFSACRVYVNGEMMLENGNPERSSYESDTGSRSVSFISAEVNEIIIAVSNYSHYYGGMIYPPALGEPEAVEWMNVLIMIIRGIQSFFAVAIAISYMAVYIWGGREKLSIIFAALCLCFAVYNSHAFMHGYGSPQLFRSEIGYKVEDAGFYCMLMLMVMMQWELKGNRGSMVLKAMNLLGGAIIFLVVSIPSNMYGSAVAMDAYGLILDGYKLTVFACILASAFAGRESKYILVLPAGTVIFAVSLAADVLHQRYEPVLLGWGSEIAGGILLCLMLAVMVHRSIRTAEENLKLKCQQEESGIKLRDTLHDIKAPVAAISGYVELLQSGIARDAGKEDTYLSRIDSKARELKIKLNSLRSEGATMTDSGMEMIYVADVIEEALSPCLDEAEMAGVEITTYCPQLRIRCNPVRLSMAVNNLLINSLRFTPAGGSIIIRVSEGQKDVVSIEVSDTGTGIGEEIRDKIFNTGFTTSQGHWGVGLSIVRDVAKEHGGSVRVASEPGSGTTFIIEVPS